MGMTSCFLYGGSTPGQFSRAREHLANFFGDSSRMEWLSNKPMYRSLARVPQKGVKVWGLYPCLSLDKKEIDICKFSKHEINFILSKFTKYHT